MHNILNIYLCISLLQYVTTCRTHVSRLGTPQLQTKFKIKYKTKYPNESLKLKHKCSLDRACFLTMVH